MDKRILIVEDDEFLRELYVDTLTAEGFKLETAVDGVEAYEKIKPGGWDLVLLDIIMPKMSGLEVMRKLKAEFPDKHFAITLLFLTNLDKGEEINEALTLGEGYLIKSQITPGDLVNEVKLYLSRGSSETPQQPTS